MIRLAINGYGRIGRCVLRALYESGYREQLQVVAINEPADLATIVHLTKYDSTHGRFPAEVSGSDGVIRVNGDVIQVSHHQQLDALCDSACKAGVPSIAPCAPKGDAAAIQAYTGKSEFAKFITQSAFGAGNGSRKEFMNGFFRGGHIVILRPLPAFSLRRGGFW